jgi:uncharacterized membrane protein
MTVRLTTLAIHIIAGSLGIIFGYIALFTPKGGRLHRASGMVFVYTLTTMALLGATIAVVWSAAPRLNAPVGLLTAYLVITGLTTVRPPSAAAARRLDLGLMLLALAVGLAFFTFGVVIVTKPGAKPALFVVFAIFGSIALLGSIGDLRLIRAGGTQTIRGTRRLARHLWRMGTALLIAAFSFFLGQAKVIPKPIRIIPLLVIPPLLVLATMLYWMWRVRSKRPLRGIVTVRSPEPG